MARQPATGRSQGTLEPATGSPRTGSIPVHANSSHSSNPNVIRSNAKIIHGTPGDDIIIGGSADQKIYGGGGNDIIIGAGGLDRIFGGKGNDRVRGGAGSDTVHGGNGNDRLFGDRGNDRLFGDRGNDRLAGDIGDDHLFGNRGNDHAAGGMGADELRGGGGSDVQSGDAGPDLIDGGKGKHDTVSFATLTGPGFHPKDPEHPNSGVRVTGNKAYGGPRAAGGSGLDRLKSNENVVGSAKDDVIEGNFDTVDGGPGVDTADGNIKKKVSANGESDPTVSTTGAVVDVFPSKLTGGTTLIITGGALNDHITVKRSGDGVTITNNQGVEVRGSGTIKKRSVHVRIPANRPLDAVLLEGGDGNDRLRVEGFGADVPVTLSGGAGNDTLVGGRGNDTLNDGAGNDTLIGGGGDDGLTNSGGRDRLYGQKGNDLLVSSAINRGDRLDGGKGLDNVSFAQAGPDAAVRAKIGGTARWIKGGTGHGTASIDRVEDLEGTEGNDVLIGDGKDNHLLGRHGSDTLLGRGGDDVLEARDGNKDRLLDGGAGHDRAILDPKKDRVVRHVESGKPKTRKPRP